MAREWALAGVPEEELQPPPPPKKPDTPRGKWENFWYHYKWVVLGIAAAVVVLAVLIGQMATRNPADYYVVLATQKPCSAAAVEALRQELSAYAEDLDGDGTVEVELDNLYLAADDPSLTQMVYTNAQKLTVHFASSDVLFFIFEDTTYQERIVQLLEQGAQFYASPSVMPEGTADGYWDWAGSALQQTEAMQGLPEHLYFGVRGATGTAESHGQEAETNMALLNRFLEAQLARETAE